MGERRGGDRKSNVPIVTFDGLDGKRSDEIAAEKAGFGSHMTYRRAKRVVDKGVPELAEAMDAGWCTGLDLWRISSLDERSNHAHDRNAHQGDGYLPRCAGQCRVSQSSDARERQHGAEPLPAFDGGLFFL